MRDSNVADFIASSSEFGAGNAGRRNRLVALIAASLFLMPVAYHGIREELGKWCEAVAMDATLNDDAAQVITWSQRGLVWDRQNLTLRNQLISWQALEKSPDEVIREFDQILEMARGNYSRNTNSSTAFQLVSTLRNSAYVRAIAKQDLPAAQEYIDEAFDYLPGGSEFALVSLLDTRGYIRYLLGDIELAEDDLELAAHLVDVRTELYLSSLRRQSQMVIDQRPIEYERRLADSRRALIYQHRGWVREALGRPEEAHADFQKAKEWGYDAKEEEW